MIGVPQPRRDAIAKATGAIRYAADLSVPRMLHARLVLSSETHALVEQIDTESSLAIAGVVAVLTAADLPISAEGEGRRFEPLARHEIVFAGQPVAMVVAENEAAAEDGAELVTVATTPLEPVSDLEAAMAPGAALACRPRSGVEGAGLGAIHAGVGGSLGGINDDELSGNVLGRALYGEGDVEAAFRESDAVVEGRFETSWVHQAYLEPQTATAWIEPDGTLVVSSSTQGAFFVRDELARLFGLSLSLVRVQPAPLGGAFGGKLLVVEPLAAGAALTLRQPVRLAFTRSEDFAAANPASATIIDLRIGGRHAGELTALEARVICDRGANREWGVEEISALLVAGPYRWGAWKIRAYGVQTNRVDLGAYRAPGATPAAFAIDSLIDELAEALAIDPVDLRLRNAVIEGDLGVDGTRFPVIGVGECLERVRAHPVWTGRTAVPPDEGVGVAIGYWPGGLEPAAAACRLDVDGSLTVVTSAIDMSGTDSGFALIAAEAFGLPPERIRVVSADTANAPYAGVSGGSKVTYTVGRAVQVAAERARERLLEVASEELEVAAADLELVDGVVRLVGSPERGLAVDELARRALAWGGRYEPIQGQGGSAQTSLAPSAAAHLVRVRVDRETGRVELRSYSVAQDVGRALNPALVVGQLRGGAAQGIGWALYEELAYDEGGQLLTGSFLDYAVPSAEQVPAIETLLVEVPAPDGPFGAKGIGEAPVIAAPAAIANAIAAATGLRLRRLPMTPARTWAALASQTGIDSTAP